MVIYQGTQLLHWLPIPVGHKRTLCDLSPSMLPPPWCKLWFYHHGQQSFFHYQTHSSPFCFRCRPAYNHLSCCWSQQQNSLTFSLVLIHPGGSSLVSDHFCPHCCGYNLYVSSPMLGEPFN
ncbi:hypothetical protein XELAEV_18038020mg [Xenopus laevis]|uniref:Uncharacterized protein n=1 Tax=Xenopus laevis TaxID=8355 RepID=A0A974CDB2_XENLA|nr:hypothetical protein XELAEV_18038020mg [Xenopus laevis]